MIRRVLMSADTVGGVWTYAMELCRGLEGKGVEVALAMMGRRLDGAQAAEAAGLSRLQVYESDYRLEWMREPWGDVAAAGDWLLDLERRTAPDVVHLNGYAHGALPFAAPVVVVAHSCVLSWWEAVKGEPAPAEWRTYRERVEGGLRAADLVVAPTAALLSRLEDLYGPLPRRRVIPNGRSDRGLAALAKRPYVLSVGRLWDEAKNVSSLARAAPSLPWPVLVAGEHESPDGDRSATDLAGGIRRLGPRSPAELAVLFGHAAIYALPARYEPFGLSILEAALAGCALVIGDIATLRELWDGCAVFVPPDDDGALAEAISGLIGDLPRRRRLARLARRRARGLGPEPMTASYLAAYESARGPAHGRLRAG